MPRRAGSGRKPTPIAIKELHGNPGKRGNKKGLQQQRNLEGKFTDGVIRPSWVKGSAKKFWDQLQKDFPGGLLKTTDNAMFTQMVVAYGVWHDELPILEKEGRIFIVPKLNKAGEIIHYPDPVTGEMKMLMEHKKNPRAGIVDKAESSFQKAAAAFGLDPTSRTRMKLPEADEEPNETDDGEFL